MDRTQTISERSFEMAGDFTNNEIQALGLFNQFKSDSVDIGSGNSKKLIPPDVAQALHRKGTITISLISSKNRELKANLTAYGKTVCVDLMINSKSESSEEKVCDETTDTKQMSESTNVNQERNEKMLKCVCGKEMKSKSGLTLHQKNCEVYHSSGGQEVKESNVECDAAPVVVPVEEEKHVPMTPLTEVPIGCEIILDGEVFCKEPNDETYHKRIVDKMLVKTVVRMPVVDGVWIACQADGSQTIMAVSESDIFNGRYPIVVSPVEEDKMEARDFEMEKERQVFLTSISIFTSARDEKLKTEKAFKLVDKSERPTIEGYAKKYGKESGPGKQDFQVLDSGYNVHLVRTPGRPSVKYKEEEMIKWLSENGHSNCLRQVVDINMWNNLKMAKQVPPDVISSLEEMTMTDDTYSLTVKVEK